MALGQYEMIIALVLRRVPLFFQCHSVNTFHNTPLCYMAFLETANDFARMQITDIKNGVKIVRFLSDRTDPDSVLSSSFSCFL